MPKWFKTRSQTTGARDSQKEKAPIERSNVARLDPFADNDKRRTHARYTEAAQLLEQAISQHQDSTGWGIFDCSELASEPAEFDSKFRDQIDKILESSNSHLKNKTVWIKCRQALYCLIAALTPLAKHLLNVANSAQSVPVMNPYGMLCTGLLILINVLPSLLFLLNAKIAEKEARRASEYSTTLEFMCQQLQQLDILDALPDNIEHRDLLLNRAMDVRSAFMLYLAAHIQHGASSLGRLGVVVKTFFAGDRKATSAAECLKTAIDNYSRTLGNLHIRVTLKAVEMLKETKSGTSTSIEQQFSVPFERNPRFTGRKMLLEELKDGLFAAIPKQFNHRIALYGMGGVGKTQCAIEYVYANRKTYERIYWITAVDQAALLLGYQGIAKGANLQGLASASPVDISRSVMAWMADLDVSWLLVVDNLDDISIIAGFLPENAINHHTLITTRNPNTKGIPAEPLEIPLFNLEDGVELLSTLSDVPVPDGSRERGEAEEIVMDLGCLPLAVEQAAAYIREVTGTFASFRESYARNRAELYKWIPSGNRQYAPSLATTWTMVFQRLPPHSVKLLQLFSFLNPDGTLVEFLTAGAEGLPASTRDVISNEPTRARALIELEKFSLIKWDRRNGKIMFHRLLQAVIKEALPPFETEELSSAVSNLCSTAFPEVTNATRSVCRKFQSQVVEPLLLLQIQNLSSAIIKARVGNFLRDEGKLRESERLLIQAVEIRLLNLGEDNPLTLVTQSELASTYCDQLRYNESLKLCQEILQRQQMVLGESHNDALITMNKIVRIHIHNERPTEAVAYAENLVELSRTALGDDHPTTLKCLSDLGWAYRRQGFPEKAIALYLQALDKGKEISEVEDRLETMGNLAYAYYAQGRIDEAIELANKCHEECCTTFGDDHPHTLNYKWYVVWKAWNDEDYAMACKLLNDLLEIHKRVLGDDHPETLFCILQLAESYGDAGQGTEALPLLEHIMDICVRSLGYDHTFTIQVRNAMCQTYYHLGRNKEEWSAREELLAVMQHVLGPEHPDTLTAMHNLAAAYWHSDDRDKDALPLMEKTLETKRKALGNEHRSTLATMEFLASIVSDRAEEIRLYEEVLRTRIKVLGPNHVKTLSSMDDLAGALSYVEAREKESLQVYKELLEKRRQMLGDDHADTVKTMVNVVDASMTVYQYGPEVLQLAEEAFERQKKLSLLKKPRALDLTMFLSYLYARNQRAPEGIVVGEEALALDRTLAPDPTEWDPMRRCNILGALAECYKAAGRVKDAINSMEEAYRVREEAYGEELGMVFLLKELIAMYEKQDQTMEVIRCRTRLAELEGKRLGWADEPPEAEAVQSGRGSSREIESQTIDFDIGDSDDSESTNDTEALRQLAEEFEKMLAELRSKEEIVPPAGESSKRIERTRSSESVSSDEERLMKEFEKLLADKAREEESGRPGGLSSQEMETKRICDGSQSDEAESDEEFERFMKEFERTLGERVKSIENGGFGSFPHEP